jgi:regulatory protein
MSMKKQNPFYQAQAILSRRDHSEAEVTLKLKRKGFSAADIAKTLAWLKNNHLLNDALFARRYIESIVRSKPVGPRWLRHKLRAKGVATSVITSALAELLPPEREKELAQAAVARWQRTHPDTAQDPQRLMRFLMSRGFSFQALPPADTAEMD